METSILAFLTASLADEGISKHIGTPSATDITHDYDKAERKYFEWLDAIAECKANDDATVAVDRFVIATERRAYFNGIKAGIKLVCEALI